MTHPSPQVDELLARAAAGDLVAWGTLLSSHESRLARLVAFRLDPRLRGRLDPPDIVQDAMVAATTGRDTYFRLQGVPLFLWLRGVVENKLLELHRHHLGTRMRDARRELSLSQGPRSDESSVAMCDHLTAGLTRPSLAAARQEVRVRLAAALEAMDPTDREVLALRHFEQLTSVETAHVLGIEERAAAKRYLRALGRLKEVLAAMPGGLTELRI